MLHPQAILLRGGPANWGTGVSAITLLVGCLVLGSRCLYSGVSLGQPVFLLLPAQWRCHQYLYVDKAGYAKIYVAWATREAGGSQYGVPSTGRRRRARQRRCRSNTDAQSDGLVLPEREAKAAHAIPDVPDLKEAVSRHLSTADRADRLDIRVAVTRKYITADSQEKTPVAVQLLQNLDHRNCRRTGTT